MLNKVIILLKFKSSISNALITQTFIKKLGP